MPDSGSDRVKQRHRGPEGVLPHDTADASDRMEADSEEHDRWLMDNRPPHHDIAW
ncbi:MAG TPA: hypothetical protein VJS67_08880 [Pseudonocardiaceae bacterium]|nr:hypothetical protein [Pseudonocardiaceae bacterium]